MSATLAHSTGTRFGFFFFLSAPFSSGSICKQLRSVGAGLIGWRSLAVAEAGVAGSLGAGLGNIAAGLQEGGCLDRGMAGEHIADGWSPFRGGLG